MHFSLCSVSGDLCMTFAVTSVLRLNECKLFRFIDFCLENKIWCNKLFVYSYYLFTMLLVVQVRSDRLKTSNFGKEEAAAAAKKNNSTHIFLRSHMKIDHDGNSEEEPNADPCLELQLQWTDNQNQGAILTSPIDLQITFPNRLFTSLISAISGGFSFNLNY